MELKIQQDRPTRNPTNGRFLSGIAPHNKGKKWDEWMDGRKKRKVLKCLRRTGRPDIGGENAKPIVAIKNGKLVGRFDSSNDAYRKTKVCARNIRSCCNYKRKTAGGLQWFFENDNNWTDIINNQNF